MNNDLSSKDVNTLLAECREKLDAVEADLIALADRNVEASPDLVNRLFRGLHSVKSAAGYLGFESLKQLSHLSESILAEVRSGQLTLSPTIAENLLSAADRMNQMVAASEPNEDIPFAGELQHLNEVLSPAAQKPSSSRRLRMLVVEDDFVCRVLLQGLLSKYGECHIAVNGREAVEAFRAARIAGAGYDLICLDVRMPEMGGVEALEQIRAIEATEKVFLSRVRIFMTTCVADLKTVVGSFQRLCDAYLIKPIDAEKLEQSLESFALIDRRQVYQHHA